MTSLAVMTFNVRAPCYVHLTRYGPRHSCDSIVFTYWLDLCSPGAAQAQDHESYCGKLESDSPDLWQPRFTALCDHIGSIIYQFVGYRTFILIVSQNPSVRSM